MLDILRQIASVSKSLNSCANLFRVKYKACLKLIIILQYPIEIRKTMQYVATMQL